MSEAYCPKCSTLTSEHAQFCSMCGTFLSFQSEHPTMLMGPVNEEGVDTGATVLAEHTPAEGLSAASFSTMATERVASSPGPADKVLPENVSAAAFLSANDDTPTIPGMLSQPDRAVPVVSSAPSAQPVVALRGQKFAETVGVPQMQQIAPALPSWQSQPTPRHGTISARKPKGFFASSRYFFVGTGLLLLIGLVALFTYPYLVKGKMSTATATTSAYAQPALMSHSSTMTTPAPTVIVAPTPVPTVAAVNPAPTPTASVAPACLQVSRHALKFSATSGGNAPGPQTIALTNTCATGAWTVRWDVPWLSASANYAGTVNGATPVVITASNTNLAANSYLGHVTFISGASQAKLTVTLTVAPPVSVQPTAVVQPTPTASAITACIKLDQNSLNFSAPAQQNPASQAIMVTNCGSDGTVTVSNTYTSQPAQGQSKQYNNGTNWLTTSAGGKLAAGGTLPVHVNVTTPAPGVYTSSIAITITTSNGKTDTHMVNVTFTVQG